jgi:hypothetical protein
MNINSIVGLKIQSSYLLSKCAILNSLVCLSSRYQIWYVKYVIFDHRYTNILSRKDLILLCRYTSSMCLLLVMEICEDALP